MSAVAPSAGGPPLPRPDGPARARVPRPASRARRAVGRAVAVAVGVLSGCGPAEDAPALAPDAVAAFAVLRDARPATAGGSESPTDAPRLDRRGQESASAARVGLLPDGRAVWLSSRADSVCAYWSSPGARAPSGDCGSLAEARRGELVSTRVREGSVDLVWILPDGVRRITIVPRAGRPLRVPVVRNAVVRALDDPPRQLRVRLPGSNTTTVRDF